MTMDDYLELLRLKNNDISITRKAKIQYKISIAIIIVITTFFFIRVGSPFLYTRISDGIYIINYLVFI